MKVLIACEFSGIMRDAFKERGHDAWSCDLLPTEREGNHIQGDVLEILNDGWDLMIAHPPCTYLTVTGNKWMKPEFKERFPNREEQRRKSIEFFMLLANASIPKICIENPIGIMSSYYRKPDQIIQPYEFGHEESKKTCLWLINLSKLSPTVALFKQPEFVLFKSGKRMAKWYCDAVKSKIREQIRSRTFTGIAKAMAEQWG